MCVCVCSAASQNKKRARLRRNDNGWERFNRFDFNLRPIMSMTTYSETIIRINGPGCAHRSTRARDQVEEVDEEEGAFLIGARNSLLGSRDASAVSFRCVRLISTVVRMFMFTFWFVFDRARLNFMSSAVHAQDLQLHGNVLSRRVHPTSYRIFTSMRKIFLSLKICIQVGHV